MKIQFISAFKRGSLRLTMADVEAAPGFLLEARPMTPQNGLNLKPATFAKKRKIPRVCW